AIWWDAGSGTASLLDCFVAVPSGAGAPMDELRVPFGEELVHYAIGASSCAVPGVPAGLEALWRRGGRLPWARLVEPALRARGRRDAACARRVPRDARARDDDARRRVAVRARRLAPRNR